MYRVRSSGTWFAKDHAMKPCIRSLSCLIAVTALALLSTAAVARTNAKQPPAGKTHGAKKTAEAKTPKAKEARPQRSAAVEKRRPAKHAELKWKSKSNSKSKSESKRSNDKTAKEATPAL